MELILKKDLPHQKKAVEAICDVFKDVRIDKPNLSFINPLLEINDPQIKENVKAIQRDIHPSMHGSNVIDGYLNIDVKMETGTGKTYVYTQTIYELHKRLGFNKFIIVVPSLPIKAGIRQFINDGYVKRHFEDECGYNSEIELHILNTSKKKKGKSFFPSAIREFVSGSYQVTNKIHVLLANMQLLSNRKESMLMRDDYDYGVEGYYRPTDAIKSTKPIVIIDEPHRFTKDKKTFEFIEKQFCPQCIIRFGATFPETSSGRGRNKMVVKDYHNLVYNLGPCDAFNQNLIKGVAKEHFEPISKTNEKVKIVTVKSKESVNFHFYKKGERTIVHKLEKGDPLSIISPAFEGIYITVIGSNFLELNNGQIKFQGEEFSTDIYASAYQEQMLKLALERHFQVEKENFNRKFKIKTLSLFFIDDIYSYRKAENSEKEPYLKIAFERLLAERIDIELANFKSGDNPEYKEFLVSSKEDIGATHAGYFSRDNSDSDEEIANEVNEILFEKKKLLSFKKEDGKYNTRRFLFSKWTLKEGWDNPNVFTITKLRSSGSENSKLQEVGRGLRLPVDENGNRISNEDFYLNYIVDFTERDFAEELVRQINGDLPETYVVSDESIEKVASKLDKTKNDLFKSLLINDYIDMDRNIISANREKFFEEYPDFASGLVSGKVKDRNKEKPKSVKIRAARYSELKELWEAINQKHFLYYDRFNEDDFILELVKILADKVFVDVVITSKREVVCGTDAGMVVMEGTGVSYNIEKPIAYGEFLIKISEITNIPVKQVHRAICEYSKTNKIEKRYFNDYSITNFKRNFDAWKAEKLCGRINYKKANLPLHPTALTTFDGSPKEIIAQGRIGTKFVCGAPIEKYLYDVVAFDSPLEKDNIQTDIQNIVVFGKIPKKSICIPTTSGSTYSPDFMYVVKKDNGNTEINLIVETKDVEHKNVLSGDEKTKIECAKVFFEQLKLSGYEVRFETQLSNRKIKQIIDQIIS